MEDVKSEKIEYLFLDIEWNQAPGTSDLDGREASNSDRGSGC